MPQVKTPHLRYPRYGLWPFLNIRLSSSFQATLEPWKRIAHLSSTNRLIWGLIHDQSTYRVSECMTHPSPCPQLWVSVSMACSYTQRPRFSLWLVWWCHSSGPWLGFLGCSHSPGWRSLRSAVESKRTGEEDEDGGALRDVRLWPVSPRWGAGLWKRPFPGSRNLISHPLRDPNLRLSGVLDSNEHQPDCLVSNTHTYCTHPDAIIPAVVKRSYVY